MEEEGAFELSYPDWVPLRRGRAGGRAGPDSIPSRRHRISKLGVVWGKSIDLCLGGGM